MATILRVPAVFAPSPRLGSVGARRTLVGFPLSKRRLARPLLLKSAARRSPATRSQLRPQAFGPVSASGEAAAETEEIDTEDTDEEDAVENAINGGDNDVTDADETSASVVMAVLETYKSALDNGDESAVADVEGFLQSLEEEKNSLASKVALLSAEQSNEKDRILRISADFDNFRKRTERERLSLMTNVQGEVVESLLPVLDNFERAKASIKVESEGEERINNSYRSIYQQFQEVLASLGVEAVDTVGTAFDPLLHEAIMREESTEYEEGIILQEFRKGFKLGERLLRPSMVKVSAVPGPAKSDEDAVPPADDRVLPADNEENESNEDDDDNDSDSA